MKLIIDPNTGMAGDMFIAALLDAAAALADKRDVLADVLKIMSQAARGLGKAEIDIQSDRATGGTRLNIRYETTHHSLNAERLREMLENILAEFRFGSGTRAFALNVLDILCRAEMRAHQKIDGLPRRPGQEEAMDYKTIHLHEAQDILVDIAGSALALEMLQIDMDSTICLVPIFYGGGTVTFSHGTFPVPAPAVQEIIEAHRIPVRSGPIARELLTPTGASLLAALHPRYRPRGEYEAPARLRATGVGLGTLEFPAAIGRKNGLTIYLDEEEAHGQ